MVQPELENKVTRLTYTLLSGNLYGFQSDPPGEIIRDVEARQGYAQIVRKAIGIMSLFPLATPVPAALLRGNSQVRLLPLALEGHNKHMLCLRSSNQFDFLL